MSKIQIDLLLGQAIENIRLVLAAVPESTYPLTHKLLTEAVELLNKLVTPTKKKVKKNAKSVKRR